MKKAIKEQNNSIRWFAILPLLLIFIIGSTYLGLNYYRPFHIAVEIFSSFIAFSILIMAVNTYEISKNIPFLFIGVAYGFAGAFNIVHIVASNGMGFFQGNTTNLSMTLSVITRYITAVSILVCYRLLYKRYKIVTPFTIVLLFSGLSVVLSILIFVSGKFPACFIPGYGNTPFKIINEYIISAITLVSIVILFKVKKYLESNVFILLQIYFYATILCNILLTFYTVQQEVTNILAHVLKLISSYCIYRAIVKVGLKTPFKLLFNEVNQKSDALKLKDIELEQTSYQLQKENELRKGIEEVLLKNTACYKLLIENSRDAIIIYTDEKVIFANESAASLMGVDKPEVLLEKTVSELLPLKTVQTVLEMLDEGYDRQCLTSTLETQLTGINDKVTYVEVASAYVVYQDKPAVLSLIRDISPHKQIEKMKMKAEEDRKLLHDTLEYNRLVTEFFSNISHELRTPLNVILSALQVLRLEEMKGTSDEVVQKRKRYIDVIKQNCYRLLRLINNLIDISKIDSGYIKPHLQNHNIVNIVEDITLSIAEYIEDKGVKFIFDTDVEEKIIACDPDMIERMMMNLLSNAVKFTNMGDQICVEVMDEGDSIQISVRDTGIGIPEEKLQVIFERFRQVDSSLSRNYEGSGIGLPLVKSLIEMHGGSINVSSTLGQGSEFLIKLPSRKSDEPETIENKTIYEDSTEKISIEFSDCL